MAVKLLEELTDFEKLTLIPMSYSRLNTMEMCEAKYFYSYIIKEPQVFGAAATLGNILHSVLEEKIEAGQPISSDQAKEYLSEYAEQVPKWDPNAEIPEDLIEAGISMLVEFVDRHDGDSFNVVAKEMPFSIVIGNALFNGFIDRVDIEDDIVYITDYKSGKREVAYKHVARNVQLGIYALAMKKMFPDKQIHASLYYLRSGKEKGHLFTDDDLSEIETMIVGLVDDVINKSTFHHTPNPRLCSFCDYAATGVCPVGVYRNRR